jgi:DNA invertase Pin-like site-specific DNA recombinase
MRPKVYSYLRFSSAEQALGDSKRRQLDAARAWAVEHGMELDEELRDEGISGFKGANLRPEAALGGFLRAIEAGMVPAGSVLVVESLDRLSRQTARKALRVLEEICEGGVDVVTLMDGKRYSEEALNRDPMSLIFVLLQNIRANEESETKAKRLRAAWSAKRTKAITERKRMSPVCPAWLRPCGDTFEAIPDRAEIVGRIFTETLAGRGQHAIANALTVEGVPTWKGGKVWHRTYVRKVLENPAVIGTGQLGETERLAGGGMRRAIVGTVPGYFPAVIEPETWERTRALLGDRKRPQGSAADKPVRFLLAKLAQCPLCEQPMTRVYKGQKKGGRPYLICTIARAKGRCVGQHVRIEPVEAAIYHNFARLLLEDVPTERATEAELARQLKNLEGWEDAVIEELQELHDARRARTFGKAQRDREADLYAQLRDIEERRETAEKEKANASSPLVEARLSRLLNLLEQGPQEDLREANAAMREAFASVVVDYREGALGFRWRHGGESWLQYDFTKVFDVEDAA